MSDCNVVLIEWSVSDLKKAAEFYGQLFGWQFSEWPGQDNYLQFKAAENVLGGLQQEGKVEPATSPVIYIQVDNMDLTLEKAKDLGGEVVVAKGMVPDGGFMAQLRDPDGNFVGLYQE